MVATRTFGCATSSRNGLYMDGVRMVFAVLGATGLVHCSLPTVGFGVMHEAIEEAMKGDVFSEFMLMSVACVALSLLANIPRL